jgi:hypothetical protein
MSITFLIFFSDDYIRKINAVAIAYELGNRERVGGGQHKANLKAETKASWKLPVIYRRMEYRWMSLSKVPACS